ncbi:MAG: serine protease [Candidatus Nealsonbacteria bacterium]
MSRNIIKIIIFFVIGMIGGIFADQIFWPYFVEKPLFSQYRLEQSPVYITEIKETTIQENTALVNTIKKVDTSIVGIRTKTSTGKILEGSGLIVTSDGLIVTLSSLVPLGSEYSFFIDGKKYSYQILKRDFTKDLALIKLGKTNLPVINFVNLDEISLGERVFVLGVNFKEMEDEIISTGLFVNEGIIKNLDKDIISTNIIENEDMLGSSLFNIKGEIIGLSTIDNKGEIDVISIVQIKEFVGL